jgi:hypothetical protein
MDYWIQRLRKDEINRLSEEICTAEELHENIDSVHGEPHRRALVTADIIGITTTGLPGTLQPFTSSVPKIVVYKGTAKVLEAI